MYPALAVLKALQDDEKSTWKSKETEQQISPSAGDLEVLWVGGEGGIEFDLLSKEKIAFTTIPAAGVHGVGLRALPGNLWQIFRGFIAARRIIKDFHPEGMFFTGGYLAVPVAFAGSGKGRNSFSLPAGVSGHSIGMRANRYNQVGLIDHSIIQYFRYLIRNVSLHCLYGSRV